MKTHRIKQIFCYGLLALGLGSCELTHEVDMPGHEPRLTLRLALTNTDTTAGNSASYTYKQLFVGRSHSILYSDESLAGMANATVKLYDATGKVVEEYVHTGIRRDEYGWNMQVQGYYAPIRNFVPAPGQRYTLRASAYGLPEIEASTTMPEAATVTELQFDGKRLAAQNDRYEGKLRFSISSAPGQKRYYRVVAQPVDSAQSRFNRSYSYASSTYTFNGGLENKEVPRLGDVFSSELYPSSRVTFASHIQFPATDFDLETRQQYDATYLQVEVQQLTEAEYLFVKTLEGQWRTDDNPFAEPQNVHSNVQGGYGALGGVTVTRYYIPLK